VAYLNLPTTKDVRFKDDVMDAYVVDFSNLNLYLDYSHSISDFVTLQFMGNLFNLDFIGLPIVGISFRVVDGG
jgi:hypothetical protein